MRFDPEDLRRHYASLSDEGLLDIDRSDLAPAAQGIYDREMARRRLHRPPEHEQEVEEESYHRPLPVVKPGANCDSVGQPDPDTGDGPPPAWLEEAACAWSAQIHPDGDYVGTGAEVQNALRDAGIPNRIVVKPPEPKPPSTPLSLYCVMVPGDLVTRAFSVVVRKVSNPIAEAEWRSQLHSFSDEELLALNPADSWGALLDRAERMKRAYLDEIARRKVQAPAS
jgi:hypothetical protein